MSRLSPWRDFDRDAAGRASARPNMFRSRTEAAVILTLAAVVFGISIGGLAFVVTAMIGAP